MLRTEAHDAGSASHRDQLTVLAEASALLFSGFGEHDLPEKIVDLTTRLVRADAYAMWRFDAPVSRWRIVAARGLSAEFLRSTVPALPETAATLPASTLTMRIGDPMLASRRALLESERIQALAVAPLRIGTTPIGSLVCYFRRDTSPSELDLQALSALGNLAAVALGSTSMREAQQLALENLARSERRYRSLAASSPSPQAIWTLTDDGRVDEDSPSWRALTGQTIDEWRTGWYEAVHPLDRGRLHETIRISIE